MNSENTNRQVGYVIIRATTARGALPLEGATVTIRGGEKESSGVIEVHSTDRSGLTPKIALDAPPRENSESPGKTSPFYVYNIEVTKEGYFSQYFQQVPIFEGIMSVQTAYLAPLPENGTPDSFTPDDSIFFEGEAPEL